MTSEEPEQVAALRARVIELEQRAAAERAARLALADQLGEREAIYRAIFDSAPVGIAMSELGAGLVTANATFLRMVGYSLGELRERSVSAITHPADLAREMALAAELLTGERSSYRMQKRYIRPDGSELLAEIVGMLVSDEHGAPRWGLAFVEEIAERRRTEQALRDSEARYRSLIEDQTELVVRWRPDGTRLFVNEAYCRFFGRAAAELLGAPIDDVNLASARVGIDALTSGLSPQQPSSTGEYRVYRGDGELAWVEWSRHGIFAADGTLREIQSVGRDVTARRAAEELSGWLAAILEATPDLVGVMGLDQRVRYLNRAGRMLRGLPLVGDIAELPPQAWMPAEALARLRDEALPTAMRAGIWRGETQIYNAAAEVIPVEQTILALRDHSGEVARMATIVRDLSEQKRVMANQIELERRLLEAQRLESLGALAGGVAHDFNNILTAIMGHVELVQLEPGISVDARASLAAALDGARRAAGLTREMLTYAGKGRVLAEPLNLSVLVRDMAGVLQSAAPPAGRLDYQLDPALPLIAADPAQMRQLLLNLVTNGLESLGGAAGLVEVGTTAVDLDDLALGQLGAGAAARAGRYVCLSVRDTGAGMDQATQRRLFEPFFSTKFVGRGLGMAAVQGIVQAHRGLIRVESAPAAGTLVRVWLPIDAPPAPARAPAASPVRGSVLVIDDEPAVRHVAAMLLRQIGLDPVEAADGAAGLAALAAGLPNLLGVLVDLTMPVMSGVDVARAVAERHPGLPVVIMSGYGVELLADYRLDQAVAGFLAKPFSLGTLRDALTPLLGAPAV